MTINSQRPDISAPRTDGTTAPPTADITAGPTRPVIISGCSGGGKSTLLDELARRGQATVPEPGRRIVEQETASGGNALPWTDLRAFLHRVHTLALADLDAARHRPGRVFLDRGLIDALSALDALEGTHHLDDQTLRSLFHRRVFLTPPWPEIYAQDGARQHGFQDAVAEYERLSRTYPILGYAVTILPKVPVSERADMVLDAVAKDAR